MTRFPSFVCGRRGGEEDYVGQRWTDTPLFVRVTATRSKCREILNSLVPLESLTVPPRVTCSLRSELPALRPSITPRCLSPPRQNVVSGFGIAGADSSSSDQSVWRVTSRSVGPRALICILIKMQNYWSDRGFSACSAWRWSAAAAAAAPGRAGGLASSWCVFSSNVDKRLGGVDRRRYCSLGRRSDRRPVGHTRRLMMGGSNLSR